MNFESFKIQFQKRTIFNIAILKVGLEIFDNKLNIFIYKAELEIKIPNKNYKNTKYVSCCQLFWLINRIKTTVYPNSKFKIKILKIDPFLIQ